MRGGYNGSLWYVSVLLIASICLYSLCKNDKSGIVRGLLPIAALAGYIYLIGSENGLEAWAFDGLIYPPIVRGFSGLALGIWLNDLQTEYNNLMSKWTIVVCNAISCILVICLLSGIESYGIVILGFCGIVLSCFYPYKATEWKINKCILAIGRWLSLIHI